MVKQSAKANKVNFNQFLFWLFSLLLILPWVYIQHQTSINSDTAWLSICAQRLLSGGSMLQNCYDTNPPLNILVYIPFIWISNILHIPIYASLFWLTLLWISGSVFLTYLILKYFPSIEQNERNILTLTFLCSITIIPSLYFTERDHFLAIMIIPLILVQIAYTYKYELPKPIAYIVLLLGGVTLLLKPHFGLIPAFLLLQRVFIQKRIWIVKDTDFIILFVLSAAYLAGVYIYFQDFINIIFPDILQAYLYYNAPIKTYKTALPYALLLTACFIAIIFVKDKNKSLLFTLASCTVLALLAYIIQMKAFTYHRLPLYALLFPLSILVTFKLIDKYFIYRHFLAYIFIIPVFVLSYLHSPLRPDFPTHKDYQDNPITNYISENCASPCSFYITYENMDIVSQIAFYSNFEYATRFPTFWFLADKNQQESTKERFANYVAEDIEQYNPSLILVLSSSPELDKIEGKKTLIEYFSFSDNFNRVIKKYKKIDNLTVDRSIFYKDTPYDFPYRIKWDVYKRVSEE